MKKVINSDINADYTQLCVMQGTVVTSGEENDFENFFLEEFNVRVKYEAQTLTNPDVDKNQNPISDTGGRNDLLFYIHKDDISKFAVKRFQFGIRWWEDVVKYNDNSHLYSEEILNKYQPTW